MAYVQNSTAGAPPEAMRGEALLLLHGLDDRDVADVFVLRCDALHHHITDERSLQSSQHRPRNDHPDAVGGTV